MSISLGTRVRAYIEMMRPANVVTAFADVAAGFAASGAFTLMFTTAVENDFAARFASTELLGDLGWLMASTAGLYAGGVVLNDYFDADLDAVERPERPIPSGRASAGGTAVFGTLLLALGVGAAAVVSTTSFLVAAAVALCAVLYDAAGKNHPVVGPVNMGLCRGGNLLLGVSAIPTMIDELWFLALIPVAYIGSITAVSRGEVHGGRRATGVLSIVLLGLVTVSLFLLGIRLGYRTWRAVPFILLFAVLVFPPFVTAALEPSAAAIRAAVRRGVLSLVVMNAAIAAGFAGWMVGLAVLALLPISLGLARLFAVT